MIVSDCYTHHSQEFCRNLSFRSNNIYKPAVYRQYIWQINNDSVMADKVFTITDLLPYDVSLNIPSFLGIVAQMPADDVATTPQQITSLRVHVERTKNKVKNCHILNKTIPISLFGVVNQMWAVCAFFLWPARPNNIRAIISTSTA